MNKEKQKFQTIENEKAFYTFPFDYKNHLIKIKEGALKSIESERTLIKMKRREINESTKTTD